MMSEKSRLQNILSVTPSWGVCVSVNKYRRKTGRKFIKMLIVIICRQ